MIQYGFSIRSPSSASQPKHGDSTAAVAAAAAAGAHDGALPPDPNAHDSFTLASLEMPNSAAAASASRAMTAIDWFAYALMIVGWLVLIRALSDFLRARRHEQLVRQSPARGLSVPIIVEGQPPELNV